MTPPQTTDERAAAQLPGGVTTLKERLESLASLASLRRAAPAEGAPSPPPAANAAAPGQCIPACPVCGGSGLVRHEVPLDDFRFGKLFPCPNMPLERLHHEGRFGLYWDEQRTLSWDSVVEINGSGEALRQVRLALERGWGWVYLWGGYGTAKSLLLKVAVAESLRMQREAYYTRMVDLLDRLRAAYDEERASQAMLEQVGYLTALPLLALDEIDRLNPTPWAKERLFQLMDRRYSAAEVGRAVTLIASNRPPEKLDGYLSSRARDGRFAVVRLPGVDLRPGMGE
jgi:DNA replication protein DnaC